MKVFRVSVESGFQGLIPIDSIRHESGEFLLNGHSRMANWNSPETFSLYPLHKAGDFWRWGGGGFVVAPRAQNIVQHFLEAAGELLPLQFDGETYWLFNCTECINCVNHEASDWHINPKTNLRAWITKWVFHPNRITQSVFTVPELSCNGILVMEESGDPEFEFKALVESEGLTGLVFEEVWDSEAS